MRNPGITRHMRDLERLKTIQAVVDRELKPGRAAERLGLSVRQIERLVIRYRAEGPVGLISRHRHRTGNRALKSAVAELILEILRDQYPDFGPTLAAEKLRDRHRIVVAKETVRQLQIASGLWIPRKLRPPRIHQPRARRACLGELIQIDDCEHRWFEDRAPACTALVPQAFLPQPPVRRGNAAYRISCTARPADRVRPGWLRRTSRPCRAMVCGSRPRR